MASASAEVILARVLQGIASGLIQPMAMVMMSEVFPREQRGRAMGLFGMGVVLSPAIGPGLGGWLVDDYSWRFVFVAIVPVCLIAMAAAAVFLPGRDRTDRAEAAVRLFRFRAAGRFALLPADRTFQRPALGLVLLAILGLFAGALASRPPSSPGN